MSEAMKVRAAIITYGRAMSGVLRCAIKSCHDFEAACASIGMDRMEVIDKAARDLSRQTPVSAADWAYAGAHMLRENPDMKGCTWQELRDALALYNGWTLLGE